MNGQSSKGHQWFQNMRNHMFLSPGSPRHVNKEELIFHTSYWGKNLMMPKPAEGSVNGHDFGGQDGSS